MKEAVLFEPIASPYLVPFDGSFEIAKARTEAADDPGKGENKEALEKAVGKLSDLQERLFANDQYSVLLIFQALDAAGKDGTVRAILTGVNPAGVQVSSFKAPSAEDLDHDFMWRCYKQLPERGRIGVWNRSHYEETLIVRVHPSFLEGQRLPRRPNHIEDLWAERFESINAFERHWARNGTIVIKFFLNVSQKEQHERFLDRVNDPEVHWKFNSGDLDESKKWPEYMAAYEAVLRNTSKPWAPWYVIPADSKPYMRRACADIIVKTLSGIEMPLPQLTEKNRLALESAKAALEAETAKKKSKKDD